MVTKGIFMANSKKSSPSPRRCSKRKALAEKGLLADAQPGAGR